MLHVRKPKARILRSSQGFAIQAKEDYLLENSPITDDYYNNPFMTNTPGSENNGSAFDPVSPPRIQRKARIGDTIPINDPSSLDRMSSFTTPKRSKKGSDKGKNKHQYPSDTTQDTTVLTLSPDEQQQGSMNPFKQIHLKQIKMNLPKSLPKSMKHMKLSNSKKSSIDLSDLAIATICIVPRHGAGIAAGRRPFERMRTSLMLHMIQDNQNASWERKVLVNNDMEGADTKKGKAQIAKLNTLLRNSIADERSCFVEKSQETVKLSKDTLEDLNANGGKTSYKNELAQRNLTCVKFLSGAYREVIKEDVNDGLSLMVVGSAYYALGKFEPALSVYQRAGLDLKKKITSSPEYTIHCAKLFNNMGCCYFEMHKYEKAMQTFQRALQLFHNDSENNYATWIAAIVDQASIMNNMAYTLIKFKQYDDASDLVDASFELQQILPENTDKTLTISTLSSMAYIYYRTKQYRLSLDTYSACVQLQNNNAMYNESDHVEVLKKMADICKKIHDWEKRIYLLRTVIVYQQCYLLEDDDEIWETHAALAETLQLFADDGGTSI